MDLKFPEIFFLHAVFTFYFFQQVYEAALGAPPELSLLPQGTESRPGAAEMEIL